MRKFYASTLGDLSRNFQIPSGRLRLRRFGVNSPFSGFCAFGRRSRTRRPTAPRFRADALPTQPLHASHVQNIPGRLVLGRQSAHPRIFDSGRPLPASRGAQQPLQHLRDPQKPPPENDKNFTFQIGSAPKRPSKTRPRTSTTSFQIGSAETPPPRGSWTLSTDAAGNFKD